MELWWFMVCFNGNVFLSRFPIPFAANKKKTDTFIKHCDHNILNNHTNIYDIN